MELSRPCKNCKKSTIIRDESGSLVCQSCGVEQEFDNFHNHYSREGGSEGTFVRVGSSSHTDYKKLKLYHANQKIDDITSRLGFSSSTTSEVKRLAEQVTEGSLGDGNWFPVFIGACCYVVKRKSSVPYSMSEVAAQVGCDLHELGRMVLRIVDFLHLKLPEFDIFSAFEAAVRNHPEFGEVESEKKDSMLKQGRLLLNCSVKWFLTTGRQPVPVVVAVLVFVAELNQMQLRMENIAKDLHAGLLTSRRRYKELTERLVMVAQALPWGKNVTLKNIVQNASFVLQYIEIKSSFNPDKKRTFFEIVEFDLEQVANSCLEKEIEYGVDEDDTENDSQYFEPQSGKNQIVSSTTNDLDNVNISHECLSSIYSNFLCSNAFVKLDKSDNHKNTRKNGSSVQLWNNSWNGKSSLSKKLLYEDMLKNDVGFNALPPSFVAGELACQRRREKIYAAKQRINEIMQPFSSVTSVEKNILPMKRKKRKRKENIVDVDWEDCIIEILLLHQVKEEEIEQGHYKRMLDLYVFGSDRNSNIFEKME